MMTMKSMENDHLQTRVAKPCEAFIEVPPVDPSPQGDRLRTWLLVHHQLVFHDLVLLHIEKKVEVVVFQG
jgi:hypothetical protein